MTPDKASPPPEPASDEGRPDDAERRMRELTRRIVAVPKAEVPPIKPTKRAPKPHG